MREALESLGREVEADLGVSMRSRIGVNTGEVLVAAGDADVVGDPVKTARPDPDAVIGHLDGAGRAVPRWRATG